MSFSSLQKYGYWPYSLAKEETNKKYQPQKIEQHFGYQKHQICYYEPVICFIARRHALDITVEKGKTITKETDNNNNNN